MTILALPTPVSIGLLIAACLILAFFAILTIVRGTVASSLGDTRESNIYLLAGVLCILAMQFTSFVAGTLW